MQETEKRFKDVYELLEAIEELPTLFLGSKSLTLLRAFLDGFRYGSPSISDTPYGFIDFHEWVALRLGYYESTTGYVNMIQESEAGDDENALDRFFQLWHEFRERKSRVVYQADRGAKSYIISQRRLDTGEIEEMDSNLIQVVKYTDDNAGFLKYVTGEGIICEKYVNDLDKVFWLANAYGFEIPEGSWQKVGD